MNADVYEFRRRLRLVISNRPRADLDLFTFLEGVLCKELNTSNSETTENMMRCWLQDHARHTARDRRANFDGMKVMHGTGAKTEAIERSDARDLVGLLLARHAARHMHRMPRDIFRRLLELSVYDVVVDVQKHGLVKLTDPLCERTAGARAFQRTESI